MLNYIFVLAYRKQLSKMKEGFATIFQRILEKEMKRCVPKIGGGGGGGGCSLPRLSPSPSPTDCLLQKELAI